MPRTWSKFQEAVFEHAEHQPKRHLIVEAVPGSGKTTTIVEACNRVHRGRRVIMCAFNTKIRDELQERVPKGVIVRTFHQLGFYAVIKSWGPLQVDRYRQRDLIKAVLPGWVEKSAHGEVAKIVSMAMARLASTPAEIQDIMERYEYLPGDPTLEPKYTEWALEVLRRTQVPGPEISLDDQVYLPGALNLRGSSADFVFADEFQDCNPAQLEIIRKALGRTGKLIAVGDRRQAIYAWRGADPGMMDAAAKEFDADVLPLSITYRCPRSVVRLVQPIVPAIEAGPDAQEGVVQYDTSEKQFLEQVRPGDLVISRVNAAIATYSMKLMLKGVRCQVLGKDLSEGLISLVHRAESSQLTTALKQIEAYVKDESKRLLAIKKEDRVEELNDRLEILQELSTGLKYVPHLVERLERLFGEAETTDGPSASAVVFSTVHKAKGLEFKRVWMLETTFRTDSTEGENLYYVAATRAIEELYLVQIPKKGQKPKPQHKDANPA